MLGRLIGTVGIPTHIADLIGAAIASGGVYYAIALFPVIAPFIGSILTLQGAIGGGAIIGF